MFSDKSYVSVGEMLKMNKQQERLLLELQAYENLSDADIFKNRIEVLNLLDKLYAYKRVKEGYAITSDAANPITPIRHKIAKVSISAIKKALEANNLKLKYEFTDLSNKGYIDIRGRSREDSDLSDIAMKYSAYRNIVRVSIYTNEYHIYKPEEIDDSYVYGYIGKQEYINNMEINKINIKICELMLQLNEDNKDDIFNSLLDLELKVKEISNTHEDITEKEFKESFHDEFYEVIRQISSGELTKDMIKDIIKKIKATIRYDENMIAENMQHYKETVKINEDHKEDYNKLIDIFDELNFKKNDDKYFGM